MVMRSMLLLFAGASLLPAQRLTTETDGRVVQLFDLRKVRRPPAPPGPDLRLPGVENAFEQSPTPADKAAAVAALLGALVEPPLGKGDALQPLGEHYLALLGSEQHAASLEQMFAAVAARRGNGVDVEIRFAKLTAPKFDQVAKPHLKLVGDEESGRYQQLLRKADAPPIVAAVIEAAGEHVEAPRLVIAPLEHASLARKTQTSYVKDFTLIAKDGAFVADPVVDVVWDGIETVLTAILLPDGMIGLACDATLQELQKPIPVFNTVLAGTTLPVSIQLPHLTKMRLRQTTVIGSGDVVALAARKSDGTFVVALVTATEKKL